MHYYYYYCYYFYWCDGAQYALPDFFVLNSSYWFERQVFTHDGFHIDLPLTSTVKPWDLFVLTCHNLGLETLSVLMWHLAWDFLALNWIAGFKMGIDMGCHDVICDLIDLYSELVLELYVQ